MTKVIDREAEQKKYAERLNKNLPKGVKAVSVTDGRINISGKVFSQANLKPTPKGMEVKWDTTDDEDKKAIIHAVKKTRKMRRL